MKSFHNDVFDNGLNAVVNNGNKMVLCKQPPTTYAEANNLDTDATPGFKVAEIAMVPADYTVQDLAAGGRECVVAAKAAGNALDDSLVTDDLHFAIVDTVNSKLLVVNDETTDQVITLGNPINIPSWSFNMKDPI